MAYSDSFPSVSPTWQCNFAANGGRIDPRATFSRSDTPPTYAAPSAVHYWSNEKHLSSENLIAYSNPVTSQWTETNTAITVNSTAAPDGTTTASNVLETAATGYHEVRETFACTNAVSHTATFYAKANGRTVVRVIPRTSSGVIALVEFTLSGAGSESLINGAATRSIAAVGSGGWYKLTVTFTGNATATGEFQINICESAGTDSYAGDATKGVYLWGAQVSTTGETVLNATSGQIARSYASTLKSVSYAGQPRFEYSATDGESMGVLIESASTNLLVNSADFGGLWQIMNATKQSGAAIAPDGTLTATAYRENDGAGSKRLLCYYTHSGTDFTISVYAKLLGNTRRLVLRESQSSGLQTVFDLASGSVVSGTGSIKSVGNGWFRCELNGSHSSTNQAAGIYLVGASSDGSDVITGYTGDGYSGLLLAHPQAENQSWASSYIDTGTSGSTVSRAADSLSVATADIAGFSEGVGTVVYETGGVASATEANQLAFGIDGATYNNDFRVGVNAGGGSSSVRVYARTPDGDQAFFSAGSISAGDGYKLAVRYELDNIAASLNGAAVVSDTSCKVPVGLDTLWIGQLDGTRQLNSGLKRIAVYNEALSDTNLQALTS